MAIHLRELVAATHTPMREDGTLWLPAIEIQAAHLRAQNVSAVFIGGTTGECHSLTLEERLRLSERWIDVAKSNGLRVVVHVGSNCLSDAKALAAQAERLGAAAISALAPSYFKPSSVDALVSWCVEVAGAAAETPFYFYDIPSLTGVALSMPDFLDRAAGRIPTLAGLKFTNQDLISYQLCLQQQEGRFDIPWGVDECLLAALALGARGAVGSTYNFAAPIYHRLMAAFARGDLATARAEQTRSVHLVKTLARHGYMASAKAVMMMLGVPVGAARQPHAQLTPQEIAELQQELTSLGFFDWIQP